MAMPEPAFVKSTRRNRHTGAQVRVVDTTHPTYPGNEGRSGKWVVECTTHDESSPSTSNVAEANRRASSPWSWCGACDRLNPGAPVKGQKFARS